MIFFASDYDTGCHPKVLEKLSKINDGTDFSYTTDSYTEKMNEIFSEKLGKKVTAYPVFSGTGANIVMLASIVNPYEGLICNDNTHIITSECGGPTRFGGYHTYLVPNFDGKITPSEIENCYINETSHYPHSPKVSTVHISQTTETGSVYSNSELADILTVCKKYGLNKTLDGARIANAVVHNKTTLKDMVAEFDAFTFGGTKNGAILAEAIVFADEEVGKRAKFVLKQAGQMASKSKMLAAQIVALLENDLWLELGAHSNAMAQLFVEGCAELSKAKIVNSVDANIVFIEMPESIYNELRKNYYFHVMGKNGYMLKTRLVTRFDTKAEDVKSFVSDLHKLAK